jgi:hypothetical protein
VNERDDDDDDDGTSCNDIYAGGTVEAPAAATGALVPSRHEAQQSKSQLAHYYHQTQVNILVLEQRQCI